jgi:hypothetical protein
MVQKAIRRSGAKTDEPTTIVAATGLTKLFVEWVQDAWKEIQLERMGWDWRVARDEIMAITDASDEYAMPSTMESINLRTVTVYKALEDEGPVTFMHYDEWRRSRDTGVWSTGRPLYFTITPDDQWAFFPPPDQAYTVRFDGVRKVEILDDTDDNDTPTYLAEEYHDGIVWQAVAHYAQHFEDGSKLQEALDRFVPYKKYFEMRSMPEMTVRVDALYRRTYY